MTAQHLIQEILTVLIGQYVRRGDDLMQIRVHELIDQIKIVKLEFRLGTKDIAERDDILVL